ncbi:hypothetical protein [Streptomyces sp. NPDC046821]|uniref:hypothetical protein n=1 Tax=Streptomyces sp. NPDC046821 TaxID=3154702 RepID=UPI0033E35EE4
MDEPTAHGGRDHRLWHQDPEQILNASGSAGPAGKRAAGGATATVYRVPLKRGEMR